MEASNTTAPAGGGSSIAAPAIRGTVWTMGGYAAGQVLRLAGNLVLTRVLFPEVFGQMALVFIFIQGLQMFSDVGTGPAIIQNPHGDDPDFLNTGWTIQAIRGLLLWAAAAAIAWPVADFYEQPSLRWLVPAAGFTAFIAGFESTAMHQLQRHLRLERLTILDMLVQVVSIVATVLLALADRWVFGPNHPSAVWAIIGGNFAASAVRVVLSHTFLPGIRNRFRVDRKAMLQQMTFGRWIFVSTVLTFLAGQSDRLIFGKQIPIALFGVYSISAMLAALPTQAVLKLGMTVIFPAYSRMVARSDFPRVFWRVRLPLLLGGAAVVSGLVACGPFLIRLLYDARYEEAGWILQYLSVAAWFQVLECTNGAALLAKGHVKWVAAGSGVKVAAMVLLVPAGFWLGGFPGALLGLVASEALKYATSATGTLVAGLPGLARDVLFSGAVAVVAAAGFGAGRFALAALGSNLFAFLASGTVAALPWGLAGLAQLRSWREARRVGVAVGAGLLLAAWPTGARAADGKLETAAPCDGQPLRTTGRVLYFCDCAAGAAPGCVAGDDTRPGTSPARPRRSLRAAFDAFNAMAGGDTVALCRGGAWAEAGRGVRNGRCDPSAPCDFRDYTPPWAGPTAPRPLIDAGTARVFGVDSSGPHHGGYRFWNLDLRNHDVSKTELFMFHGDVSDVDICNVRMEGSYLGVNMQPGGTGPTHMTIRRSQLHAFGFAAIYGGTHGLVIDGNTFENNGVLGRMLDHTIYLGPGSAPEPYRDEQIVNNQIRTDRRCGGVMVVLHGQHERLRVENNTLVNRGGNSYCYAIQSAGSIVKGRMREVRIARNRIVFEEGGGSTALEVSACERCSVTDNTIRTGGVGIAIGTTVGGNNGPTTDTVVQHNSVYVVGAERGVVLGRDPGNGGGFVVEDNAVFTDGACYDFGRPLVRSSDNFCRGKGGAPVGAVWVNAPGGDFTPAPGGPLAGRSAGARP